MSLLDLLNIGGGIALILFGVRFLRKALDRLFGPRLGTWMARLAGTWPRAFISGFCASLAAPSSTTISALAVQTLDAGTLTARKMLAVIFGANIGLTVLVLIGSVNIEQFAPILVLFGVLLFQFTKPTLPRGIGQFLLSLGFIFLGIGIIKAGAKIDPNGDMAHMVEIIDHYPVVLAIVSMVLAFILQSSTATILLVVGLGGSGLVLPRTALGAVVGANVGIALTTLMLGWRSVEARRLAVGNLLMKGGLAILVLIFIAPLAGLFQYIPGDMSLKVGYSHTAFNIIVAAIGLPLIPVLDRLLHRFVPAPTVASFGPRFINADRIDSVALSLGQSRREILRISELIQAMLDDLWTALQNHDDILAADVSARDDQIDLLDAEIKRFLTTLAREGMDDGETAEQMRQLRYLSELETIGDVIDKNLCELVLKKIRRGLRFSDAGKAELNAFFHKVRENMLIAETAFNTRNRDLAEQLLRHKERLNIEYRTLRDRHLARLNAGLTESHETSAIHMDVLSHLKRINSCVSHIAYAVLYDSRETRPPEPPAPEAEASEENVATDEHG